MGKVCSVEGQACGDRDLQMKGRERHPVMDISYVELPEKATHRIDASGILGGASFLAMLLVPGAVEGGAYMLAVALVAACGICAHLSIKEEGKRGD